ncbi:GIY-YIG nuclease family protein [Desulfobacter latus]|uniref:GIY-YIG nuclease family protein n=1 Tax=Desulfobacter latus TaxID=2292 RepID=A0A850TBQ6_9BACT|nr:GIY-YIG nuclease family protein [Desulfobacter latus]NWH06885.1 GIY-YIG nuclease family protein [Desulfobacter latus]
MISINIYCSNCQQQYQFIKDEKSAFSIKCEQCGNTLVDISPINGYIYILSNPSMPDLLKIGFTTRSVDERIAELNSSTGVPENFVLEAYFCSNTPENDERLLHIELSNYRINNSREFFRISVLDAIKEVEAILGRSPGMLSQNRQEELIRKKAEKDIAADKIRKAERLYQSALSEKIGGLALQKLIEAAELGHAGALSEVKRRGYYVSNLYGKLHFF